MDEPMPIFTGVRELKAAIQAVLDSLDDATNHTLSAARDNLHWGMSNATGFSEAVSKFISGLPIRDNAKLKLEELFHFNFHSLSIYRSEPLKGMALLRDSLKALNQRAPKKRGPRMKVSNRKIHAKFNELKAEPNKKDLTDIRIAELALEALGLEGKKQPESVIRDRNRLKSKQ